MSTESKSRRYFPGSGFWNLLQFAICIFQFAICNSPAWAVRPYQPVHPDPVLESWRWRSFPELNGLGLRCLAEAKDKAMWFGVDDGVRRYDGAHWTVYTPKDGLLGAPVHALCGTQDGSIYAGTNTGISRFKEGKWSRVFPPEGNLPWPVNDLMESRDGGLWAGTAWGALRLSQEGSVLYTTQEMGSALRALAPYVRLSVVPDAVAPARPWEEGIGVGVIQAPVITSRGRAPAVIYALAPGGPGKSAGLKVGDRITAEKFAGPHVTLTIQQQGRAEPFEVTVTRKQMEGSVRDFPIYDVYEDREGTIWLGLLQGEIIRCDIRNIRGKDAAAWRLYTEKDGLDVGYGPRIAQTQDGVIWTVSENSFKGVNRFDGKAWTHFRLSALKGTNLNPSILETRDRTLWVGGMGTFALHAFRDGAWRVYGPLEVPVPWHRTRLLETSDGALWVAGLGQEAARLDYGTPRWTTYEGLWFQCETPDGAQWFVSQDSSVVRRDGQGWTRYGVEDGLIDRPDALIATQQGVLWAAGSHDSTAATARLDGMRWSFQTHPRLSWGIWPKAVYESSDGNLWFGARGGPQQGQLGGILRFDGKTWTHYAPPEAPAPPYGIGQTADGVLYVGGTFGLRRFDGQAWMDTTEPNELASLVNETVYAGPKGDLWVGTRTYGAFHYDGKTWTRYDMRDGLADNRVISVFQTGDGNVCVATLKGVSRFDGKTWITLVRLPDLGSVILEGGIQQSRDGALWINAVFGSPTGYKTRTVRYEPDVK